MQTVTWDQPGSRWDGSAAGKEAKKAGKDVLKDALSKQAATTTVSGVCSETSRAGTEDTLSEDKRNVLV